MSREPSSIFSGLTSICIRDDYVSDENVVRDSVLFTFLGIGSSILTVYALSLLGLFV